jgi:hypothetical protein
VKHKIRPGYDKNSGQRQLATFGGFPKGGTDPGELASLATQGAHKDIEQAAKEAREWRSVEPHRKALAAYRGVPYVKGRNI